MRDLRELDSWRVRDQQVIDTYGNVGDETCGVFEIPHGGWMLLCVASTGLGWDHVSVSTHKRCPSWTEMDFVKRRFFRPTEVAFQLHPAESRHISLHPYALHLWRCQDRDPPLPPGELV